MRRGNFLSPERFCGCDFAIGSLFIAVMLGACFARLNASPQDALAPLDPQRLWALTIGISDYQRLEPLQFAASDARAIGAFLRSPRGGGIPGSHVESLLESQATRTRILVKLEELADSVQSGDRVFIFISGHGQLYRGRKGYFIPSDCNQRQVTSCGISFGDLKDLIELYLEQAGHRILLSDFCHSGEVGVATPELIQKIRQLVNEAFIETDSGGSLNLLSSRPYERSLEMSQLGRGVLTHTLLEALNGASVEQGSPMVSALDLVRFVREQVPRLTASQQHPMINNDFDPNLVLAYLDRPGPQPREIEPAAVLALMGTGQSDYARIEWVDPSTGTQSVRRLSREDEVTRIGSLLPGRMELQLIDSQGQPHSTQLDLQPGLNEFALDELQLSRQGFRGGQELLQVASLASALPRLEPEPLPYLPPPQRLPLPPEASLLMRLPQGTQIYLDGNYFGRSPGPERLMQLQGLSAGSRLLRLVPSPQRQYRFRLELRDGPQLLDMSNGELRVLARTPDPPALQAPPPALPAGLRAVHAQFRLALWEERLVTPAGNSAWDFYQQMQSALPVALGNTLRRQLVVAMGDRAQQIMLQYIGGASIKWNAGLFDEGATLIQRVQNLFRADPTWRAFELFFQGRAEIERGNYQQAVNLLQRTIQVHPEADYARNALGLAFWKQGQLQQAIPPLQQAIAFNPIWIYPRVTLALIYMEQRLFQQAEQTLQAGLRIDNRYSPASRSLGQLYLIQQRLSESEPQLNRAIQSDPGNAYAYDTLGGLYRLQGRDPEAEQMFRLAVQLEPREPSFQVHLAEVLQQRGDLKQAEPLLSQAARDFPGDFRTLRAYAGLLSTQGRAPQGEDLLREAAGRFPDDANLQIAYGAFLQQQGRIQQAVKVFRSAVRTFPSNAIARFNLANSFVQAPGEVLEIQTRRLSQAEKELDQAARIDPYYANPPYLLGRIRLEQGRFEKALQQLEKARSVSVDSYQQQEIQEYLQRARQEVATEMLATARQRIDEGKQREAWAVLAGAHRLAPESPPIRQAMLELQSLQPGQADASLLGGSTLARVLGSAFWKRQIEADSLWKAGRKEEAEQLFASALQGMSDQERQWVGGTDFNLQNEDYGIHALVSRWGRRMLEEGDASAALQMLEAALGQRIFGQVPGLSSPHLAPLMWPQGRDEPQKLDEFEMKSLFDAQAHRVYAAALAAAGRILEARSYLAVLEPQSPDLEARLLISRSLSRGDQWGGAASFLMGFLDRTPQQDQEEKLAEAYLLLAELQCRSGDCPAGELTLQRGLDRLPGNQSMQRKLQQIRR